MWLIYITISLFACWFQPVQTSQPTVFFSHKKPAPVSPNQHQHQPANRPYIRVPQLFKWTQIKLEIVSFPFRGHFEGRNGSDSLVKLENRCQTAGQQKRFKENRSRMLLVFAMLDRIGKRLVSHVIHFCFFSSYSSNCAAS